MSENIAHAVSMRFGIGIFDPAWLDARLALFEATMLPALKAQTAEFDFEALVDVDLPWRWKGALRDLLTGVGRLREVVLHKDRSAACRRQIAGLVKRSGADFVISTRIDDDDSMTPRAFEMIQAAAGDELLVPPAFIAIRSGVRYSIADRRGWATTAASLGIGLSFVATPDVHENIWSFNHSAGVLPSLSAKNGWPLLYVEEDAARWLCMSHSLSDSDHAQKRARIMKHGELGSEALDPFPIDHDALERWRELSDGLELIPETITTHRMTSIENEIDSLRRQRKTLGERVTVTVSRDR